MEREDRERELGPALADPDGIARQVRREAAHVVAEHVEFGPALDDPLGQLPSAAAAEHHSGRIEAASVVEAAQRRLLTWRR